GQLDVGYQIALVLDGDEPVGDAGEEQPSQADQADVDEKHDDAEAETPAHGLAVRLRRPLEEPVEAPKEFPQSPVYRPDSEPAERPPRDRAREEQDQVDAPSQQSGFQAAGRRLAALFPRGQTQPDAQRR